MSRIPLHLPKTVKVIGSLRTRNKPINLDQDMLSIELPGRVFIDVGWYPDLDPNGEYVVQVFHDTVDDQLEGKLRTRDTQAVVNAVYRLVEKYDSLAKMPDATSIGIPISMNGRLIDGTEKTIKTKVDSSTSILLVVA